MPLLPWRVHAAPPLEGPCPLHDGTGADLGNRGRQVKSHPHDTSHPTVKEDLSGTTRPAKTGLMTERQPHPTLKVTSRAGFVSRGRNGLGSRGRLGSVRAGGWLRPATGGRLRFFRAVGSVRASTMGSVRSRRFSFTGFLLRRALAQFCAAVMAPFPDAPGIGF